MAISIKPLTRDWIQFLKNNQIVSLKSDPKTGRLNYSRPVTSSDLIKFLLVKTDHSERDIKSAIRSVKNNGTGEPGNDLAVPGQSSERGVSDWMHYGMSPGVRPNAGSDELTHEPNKLGNNPSQPDEPSPAPGKPTNKLKYDPNSVSDVDFREVPNEPNSPKGLPAPEKEEPTRKPRFKYRNKNIKEDIRDKQGEELSEKEIEAIFRKLATDAAGAADAEKAKKDAETPSDAEVQAKRDEDFRKMKRLIRDVMTDSQRKSLWRMLNEA